MGDSFTTGTRFGGQYEANWVARVRAKVQMDDLRIDLPVAAYGGQGFLTRGEGGHVFADGAEQSIDAGTAGLVVFGGANDVGAPGDVPGAIRRLCAAARKTARGLRILLVTPPWPTNPGPGESFSRFTAAVRTGAADCRAEVVDPVAEKWFPDLDQHRSEYVGADGVHPTDGAHAVFADRMYRWIKRFGTK